MFSVEPRRAACDRVGTESLCCAPFTPWVTSDLDTSKHWIKNNVFAALEKRKRKKKKEQKQTAQALARSLPSSLDFVFNVLGDTVVHTLCSRRVAFL